MTTLGIVDLRNKVTVGEAARRSGRHSETVKRWLREGRLRGQKLGLIWLIDAADLQALLDNDPRRAESPNDAYGQGVQNARP